MRLSTILTLLVSITGALALAVAPRQRNGCFDMTKGACVGRQADSNNATIAITNACNKVTSCTPGETRHGRGRITGIIKGFPCTATLYVGDMCGGVNVWNTPSCVELFNMFVDARCEAQRPSGDGLYQLGYQTAPCDGSFVSFNFGG
ncbi:hypothetical protein K458DRAFT_492330 [Lentithecium fluviatile CBS 122367]|uniref:Cyanovirin-N domain-containing protein n=1 Tax=Lentithecium fluviatile CBS 122367 TaxID=1168545 RepID=A0A6G1IEP3_9PLEO|nr:hypothetical protein K458DRAFT_492330 [Lentithecium fluviatile CBS 122367]